MLTLVYAQEAIPNTITRSVFLAGPSLRPGQEIGNVSWREKALQVLKMLEYDGVVFIPEAKTGNFTDFNYENQIQWETKCLRLADNILLYLNRDMDKELYGLTSNDEWGQWKESGKCILITEHTADHVRYQEWWANELKVPLFHDLTNGIKLLIDLQKEGEIRSDGERFVPLEIWNLDQFKSWYTQLKENGNKLQDAKVLKTFRIPSNNKIFAYSLWVNVFITNENRMKNNEFIISRPDISSCLLYYWRPDPMECEIVLVSEFRSPVNNSKGKVFEIPGGSSLKPGIDPKETIIEELEEECGFKADVARLNFVQANQLAATILTHKSHLFAYKLNNYELDILKSNQNKIFGVESESERTEIHVVKVKEIVDADWIDWANMGMILSILMKS